MSDSGTPLLKNPKRRAPARPNENLPKKSAKNAFVIFLGQAESGKSTTLNKIFGDREISPVERETGTDEVLEFTSSITGGYISWIDTPGLGDINGLEWDARIISTLVKFRNTHEQLKSALPNIVILFARFDDNRIQGDASSFVKMIKSIDTQRPHFLDKQHNNLILVLTHVMNGKPSLLKDPEPRLQIVKSVLKSYAQFPYEPIIVLAENEAEDRELEPEHDSHRLPNGELYPQNLFKAILKICADSGDTVGAGLFKEAFSQRRTDISIELKHSLPLLSVQESQDIIPFLSNLYLSTRITVMFDKLNTKWNAMNKSLTDPGYQRLLKLLEQNGYKTLETLPKDWETIKKLVVQQKYDPHLTNLMENVLHFVQPELKPVGVGYSYSLDQDRCLGNTPLELDNFEASPLLKKLPHGITYKPELETEKIIFHLFRNRKEYSEKRREHLCVRNSTIELEESKLKCGYNILSGYNNSKPMKKSLEQSNQEIVTILKEFRVGRLIYRVDSADEQCRLDFQTAVGKLKPFSFSKKDRHIRTQWREFFSDYGTHLVTDGCMGGAMEVTIDCDLMKTALDLKELDVNNANLIERTLTPLLDFEKYTSAFPEYIKNVQLVGGNGGHGIGAQFLHLPYQDRVQRFREWKLSLKYDPKLLTTDLKLIEMKKYMERAMGISPPVNTGTINSKNPNPSNPVIDSIDEAIRTLFTSVPAKAGKKGLCRIA